ncbi:putative fatty acyl-CoA reductase CG5065 isoform X2 [Leptinotarsa decemlineata]
MSEEGSPVTEWYKGRSIFITGGSGFMGKVMVEKLLYSCPGIKNIYLLLRNKRGKSSQQRLDAMYQLPMFERLRKSQPDAFAKIVLVNGDVNTEGLGLKTEDFDLLINNVSVVFHMAATLKLEASLKDAIEQNTAGTARVIDVCKQIKKLDCFVYFSTAFCSADVEVFEERVYEKKDDPRDVMSITKWLNSEALETATKAIIAPHPNTYTYSKRLAETLVADEKDNMPVCIVRPSIVIPSAMEPVPGWVDNLNGPVGLLVGAGKGVIRSMHCKGEHKAQVIPVDYAINASICIAQAVGSKQTKSDEVPVYNLTVESKLQITYQEIVDKGRRIVYDYPFEMQIWYPDGDIRSSKFVHNIYSVFYHWIPAILIDLIMFICGQKTFMMRIQKKIYDGLELLQFFSTREWHFRSEKFAAIQDSLTKTDQELFPMLQLIPIEEYMLAGLLGVRQYCLKEDLSSLPRCRRKQKLMYLLHVLCVYGFYFYIFYLLLCYFSVFRVLFDFVKTCLSYIPIIGSFVSVTQ